MTADRLDVVERLSGAGHWVWVVAENRVEWSRQTATIFGVEPAQAPTSYETYVPFVHPDDLPTVQERIQAGVASLGTFEFEHRAVRPDGEVRVVHCRAEVHVDADGRPESVHGVTWDVTEQRQGERALLESEARFRQLAEGVRVVVWLCDLPSRVVRFVNRRYEEVYGWPSSELVGDWRAWLSHAHPDDRPGLVETVDRHVAKATDPGTAPQRFEVEYRIVRPDGVVRWLHTRIVLIPDESGRPHRLAGVSEDVTDRHEAEAALAESEGRFRQIAEHVKSGLWLFDTSSQRFLYVNPAYEQVTGQTVAELNACPDSWQRYIHPDDRDAVLARVERDRAEEWPAYDAEHRIVLPDGSLRWVRVRSEPVRGPDGQVRRTVGSIEDVTGLREAEAALRASESRLRRLADGFPFILWLGDVETGATQYVNPAYERLFDRPADEVRADPRAWLKYVHPEDRPRMEAEVAAAAVSPLVREQEYRVILPDGALRWMRWLTYPLTDEEGGYAHRVAVVEDVTDRRLLQDELLQAQKLQAVGRLAGGIAHDFNNQLFVILNHLDDAFSSLPAGSAARDDLRRAREAAERVSTLTDQLLTFSRQRPAARRHVDLSDAVREMAQLLERTLGTDVQVVLDLAEELPRVAIDVAQLQQVLVNLAVNARDAMPTGGTLTLSTRPDVDPLDPSRKVVALRVTDTGEGMEPEVMARAFDPFFTTKAVGKGTGLGLSMVYGIAEQHGGHALIDSTPHAGTSVTVLLPLAEGEADGEAADALPAGRLDGRDKVVLVVEDADDVRLAMVRPLRRAGYTVHEAARPQEAIDLCQHSLWRVDLLVTDLVMPGMSGRDLVRELERLGLTPPVVYVSGYAGEVPKSEMEGERSRFVQKPFRAADLLAVAGELESAPPPGRDLRP